MMIQKKMQLDNELLSPIYKLMSVSNSIVQKVTAVTVVVLSYLNGKFFVIYKRSSVIFQE